MNGDRLSDRGRQDDLDYQSGAGRQVNFLFGAWQSVVFRGQYVISRRQIQKREITGFIGDGFDGSALNVSIHQREACARHKVSPRRRIGRSSTHRPLDAPRQPLSSENLPWSNPNQDQHTQANEHSIPPASNHQSKWFPGKLGIEFRHLTLRETFGSFRRRGVVIGKSASNAIQDVYELGRPLTQQVRETL